MAFEAALALRLATGSAHDLRLAAALYIALPIASHMVAAYVGATRALAGGHRAGYPAFGTCSDHVAAYPAGLGTGTVQ